jgi:hypothetical protein
MEQSDLRNRLPKEVEHSGDSGQEEAGRENHAPEDRR